MFAGHAQQTMTFFYAATRFFTNTQKEKEKKDKMIEQKEKYTLCSANVHTDFAPHSGPFPCRHPLWNHKRVFRDDFHSFFTHTHPHTYAHTHTHTHIRTDARTHMQTLTLSSFTCPVPFSFNRLHLGTHFQSAHCVQSTRKYTFCRQFSGFQVIRLAPRVLNTEDWF